MKSYLQMTLVAIGFLLSTNLWAQKERFELLPFGNMNQWQVREIKESLLIGGNTGYLYSINDSKDTLKNNTPYKNTRSPWATSSVLAVVSGITKGSVTVFPEKEAVGMRRV